MTETVKKVPFVLLSEREKKEKQKKLEEQQLWLQDVEAKFSQALSEEKSLDEIAKCMLGEHNVTYPNGESQIHLQVNIPHLVPRTVILTQGKNGRYIGEFEIPHADFTERISEANLHPEEALLFAVHVPQSLIMT